MGPCRSALKSATKFVLLDGFAEKESAVAFHWWPAGGCPCPCLGGGQEMVLWSWCTPCVCVCGSSETIHTAFLGNSLFFSFPPLEPEAPFVDIVCLSGIGDHINKERVLTRGLGPNPTEAGAETRREDLGIHLHIHQTSPSGTHRLNKQLIPWGVAP